MSNTIARSEDSRSWLPGTIFKPDENTIKSTCFFHHKAGIPTIHQLKMVQEVQKLVDEMKNLYKCNFNKTNRRKANENNDFKENSLSLHWPLFCKGCEGSSLRLSCHILRSSITSIISLG